MNFEFSEEQKLLRDQASNFLANECPIDRVRAVLEGDQAHDQELWGAMIKLGWTATTIPEQYGGLGLGHLELCVLAEELGRSLAPTPFASSVYLATEAVLLYGNEQQKMVLLSLLAEGKAIGTLAVGEGVGAPNLAKLETRVAKDRVSGTKLPVPDGETAHFAIVLVGDGDATSMVLVDLVNGQGVERTRVRSLDGSKSYAEIRFSDAPCEILGVAGRGAEQINTLFTRAAIPFAFEQIGGAQASMDMARAYALERYAFGRPIASFQAIKHKLADMYIANTLARSNCYYGAWALSTDAAELPIAAAAARVSATEAFHECAKENIQIHGGMGFTWEFNCHLYYRRSKILALNLGSPLRWKERLISAFEHSNL